MGLFSGIGKLFGAGKGESKYRDEINKALAEYERLNAPTIDQLGGGAISSAYGKEDPRLRDLQMQTIDDLRGIYEAEGLDDRAQARLDEIRRKEDIQSRGAREAISQNARSRGMGTNDLVDQLINVQRGADRRSGQDMQVAGDLEQRKMAALQGAGNMATSTRGQEFNKMSALDRIREFNQQNKEDAYRTRFGIDKGIVDSKAGIYENRGVSRGTQQDAQNYTGKKIVGKVAKKVPILGSFF